MHYTNEKDRHNAVKAMVNTIKFALIALLIGSALGIVLSGLINLSIKYL